MTDGNGLGLTTLRLCAEEVGDARGHRHEEVASDGDLPWLKDEDAGC